MLHTVIISLSQYQIDMLGKQNLYASFYIKNAFERIEEFLTPTLPLFKKNIESVQFNILSKHNKFNSTSRIYKFKNTGSYINTRISEYLNKLESAIFKFEPKNVTSQYEKKEEVKEIEETIEIKKSVLSKIKNFKVLEIQKTESALISEEPFTLVSRVDNDYILEHDTSKTKLITSANLDTSNKVSQKAISAENSDNNSADEAVKNFNMKEQAAVSDVNEIYAVKTILNYYDEHFQPSENSNTIGTSSSNFILAICLPILSLIIISALIPYCVKKYKKRKEFSNDQSLVVENIEIRQFIDS